MGAISRFEAAMQGLVEGSFGRVFRSKLQPVELSEQADPRDGGQPPAQRRPPHRPQPLRHLPQPARLRRALADLRRSIKLRLADAIIAVARERNYMLSTRPVLRLHLDPGVITGQARIETQTVEARAVPGQQAPGMSSVDETRAMSPEEAREIARQNAEAQQQEVLPPAWLTAYQPVRGKPMQLMKPVIHIGRHLTNDIVVNDKRVSRHHAEMRYEHGQFVLYDLGSTNGVGINGVLTRQPVPLKNNDIISVGSHDYVFQRR